MSPEGTIGSESMEATDEKENHSMTKDEFSTTSSESDNSKRKVFPDDSDSDNLSPHKTYWEKFVYYCKTLRMEPGFLVFMTASVMGNIMANDLQLDRACRVNKGYNDTTCDVLMANGPKPPAYSAMEIEVQKVISEIGIWSEFVENFFPIMFALFLGAWSDVYGCKLPFLLNVGGVVVRYGGLLLCTHFTSWNAQIISLFSVLPGSLTGSRIAISMVLYSYVSITSSLQERTIRVGILTAIRTFGKSSGSALGGHLKRSGKDYFYIFGIGGGLCLISFIYLWIVMPNPIKGNNTQGFKGGRTEAAKNILNWRNPWEAAKAFFKPREYGIRTQLYLLMAVLIFTMAPMQGEDSVLLLFVRNKLNWSTAYYAEYGTFRMLIAFGGGLVSVGLMVHLMKLSDWKLGLISCFSQIAGSLVYAFAHTTLMMYIAPVVDILNGTMLIAARTMISKISPVAEFGKINAFIAVIDSTTPLWGNPMYNAVYRGTLDTFPGAIFLVSAALTVPPVFLFLYFGWTKTGIPIHEQAENAEKRKLKSKAAITP